MVVELLCARQVRVELLPDGRAAVGKIHEDGRAAGRVEALDEAARLRCLAAAVDALKQNEGATK